MLCLQSSKCILLIKLFFTWEQNKEGIQLCYGAYNLTKRHCVNSISVWFQWVSLSNLFPKKFWIFWTLYFACGCKYYLHIWYVRRLFINKLFYINSIHKYKVWMQRPPDIFQNVEEDWCNLNFIRVNKCSSSDQSFVCVSIWSSQTFLNSLRSWFLAPCSKHLFISSAALSYKTWNTLPLPMLVCYIKQTAFFRF